MEGAVVKFFSALRASVWSENKWGGGGGATPLDPPLIMFSTVFILPMHGNENFTPPPSLRRRRNLIPVSNVCEAADSTNCRKYVSYTPST